MRTRAPIAMTTEQLARRARHAVAERGAFSLVELVVVLLIMSIFGAVAAPSFLDSLLFHRVESAARRVKADIDYTRQRARLTSTTQTITFSDAVYTTSAKHIDRPNSTNTVSLKQAPYLLNSATASFGGAQTLAFNGYGAPSSGGAVVLKAKSHQCTVTVEATTGRTTISSNHPGGGQSSGN